MDYDYLKRKGGHNKIVSDRGKQLAITSALLNTRAFSRKVKKLVNDTRPFPVKSNSKN